ncbi:MAG: DUF4212 domain-containing protein [Rhodothermales bacterium]
MDKKQYWQKQIRRTIGLLVIWAAVAFGVSIFGVEYFNQFDFNGIPFGFWMAQQGSIIIFVLLILAYTLLSERADREAGL